MKSVDFKDNNYLFIYPDGNIDNVPIFSDEELSKKEAIFMLPPFSYQNEKDSLSIVEEINAFIKSNSSVKDMLIMRTGQSNFDFFDELNMEEFFYKHYDQIEHPEKIQLRVPTEIFTNEDNTLQVVYDKFSLSHCKSIDQKIEMFIKDIKESDLSPFERVLATYVLCTRFIDSNTDYEENGKSKLPVNTGENVFSSSMHIFSDGNDEYKIKCAGYTDMFARMLKKMDIRVTPMGVFNFENGLAHVVAMADIFDEKYDIDGRYICDLRFDSDTRKMVDDVARNNGIDKTTSLYYGCDSLLYFGLSVDDYELLSGFDKYDTPTKYRTKLGEVESRDEVALESLDVSKIRKAFGRVTGFRYAIGENLDEYLAKDNAVWSIGESIERTIGGIESSREFIKNARNKSFSIDYSSEAELNRMLDSSKTDTTQSSNEIKK